MDPRATSRFASTRMALLNGYLRAIRNSAPSFVERGKCYFALLRYLCQFNKWARVFSSMLRGAGLGSRGATKKPPRQQQAAQGVRSS